MMELKRCPFCGGEAELIEGQMDSWIQCKKCNVQTDFYRTGRKTPVEVWNKRTIEDFTTEALIERLEEYMKEIDAMAAIDDFYYGKQSGVAKAIEIVKEVM